MLTILGGSTPFTAALVEALRGADLPDCELRLFGQDIDALARMQRYAARRLPGFAVSSTRRLDEAADGASIVVNQIRFGGLDGRARDEALANRFQLPADETLGPCGLTGALRVVPRLRELAEELGRRCPEAWVLNLSNPLSVATAAMIEAGAPAKCFGLCELPRATVLEACRVLGKPADEVDWQYAGLNHRGFVFGLTHLGEPLPLPELLGAADIFGITSDDIRRVGALPLKYFRLSDNRKPYVISNRAAYLNDLKDSLSRELELPQAPPPSLQKRALDWYAEAVVPMIAAICSDRPRQIVVNVRGDDGLVCEVAANVSRHGVQPLPAEPPEQAKPWLKRWTDHERAMLAAVRAPSADTIEAALSLDPVVPSFQVRELSRAIVANHVN